MVSHPVGSIRAAQKAESPCRRPGEPRLRHERSTVSEWFDILLSGPGIVFSVPARGFDGTLTTSDLAMAQAIQRPFVHQRMGPLPRTDGRRNMTKAIQMPSFAWRKSRMAVITLNRELFRRTLN
jgi:hypothetical protein